MDEKENIRISKFISLVLRHQPETIGLVLDQHGWADSRELISKMNSHGFHVSNEILNHVVITNSKQRFAFNENKSKIRASQGHSVAVELNLEKIQPPQFLYHGTAAQFVNAIQKTGLEKRSRQHVHLSGNAVTALAVGKRHGKPIVFIIEAQHMHQDGFIFPAIRFGLLIMYRPGI